MKLIGIGRIGRDAEVRYIQDGTPVASVTVAWNYGRKGGDGQQPTQWAELSLWGDRAEKLAPFLQKGKTIFAVVGDAHVETYEKRDGGQGSKLVGRIESIEFAGGPREGGDQGGGDRQRAPAAAQAPRPAPAPRPSSGFDDMDNDIPF